MTPEEIRSDLEALHAETMALQFVVGGILQGLIRNGMESTARGALDYADTLIEVAAMKLGDKGRAGHTAKMMDVVEALRKSIS